MSPPLVAQPAAIGRAIEHWTIQDLRRTVATHMARLGVDDIVVERVLAHRIGGVKGVYNRYRYLDEKRAALALWAKEMLAQLSSARHGLKTKPADEGQHEASAANPA